MGGIEIRRATTADLAGVVRVGHETWPPTYTPIAGEDYVREGLAHWWTEERFRPAIEAGQVWVAAEGDDVLAMTRYGDPNDGAVTIWMLYVLPDQQGQGLGGRLIDAVVAAHPDATTLRLSHLEGNASAAGFYRSRGFVETHHVANQQAGGPDEVWMEKPLTTAR